VVRCSQWVQALGYQILVEEYRRQKPATSGFITWEFNEPWPDLNWGIIDSDQQRKHAHAVFARSSAPRLASARLPTVVWAPGSRFSAEIHLSGDDADPFAAEVRGELLDAGGRILASASWTGSCSGASRRIGDLVAEVPPVDVLHLRLRATCADGAVLENSYVTCVLPGHAGPRVRGVFVSGGCYEDATSLQFLHAAGFDLTVHHASPDRPLRDRDVDLAGCAVVVLGPVFNPLSSLEDALLRRLDAAVRAGAGLVYLGYNTSAYVSGRYAVDDLAGSSLEALLPATFAADCYRNSEDPLPGGPLTPRGAHPLWHGIDLAGAPDPGLPIGLVARADADVIATRGGDPWLLTGRHGSGRVAVMAGGYGGHNYQGVGLRGWPYFHRLLGNILEWAARGTTGAHRATIAPFAPLLALPRAELEARAGSARVDGASAAWTVELRNRGASTAFAVQIANPHPDEGVAFDWHVDHDYLDLLPGEARSVAVRAEARPGHALPADLRPIALPWPLAEEAGPHAAKR
jgi:hypothetical protein